LKLEEGVTQEAFQAKLPGFVEQHVPPRFWPQGAEVRAFLQPLSAIHLHSHLENEIEANGDASVVYIFLAIAVFILLIACVNFMNLATARSASRAKEVGMRKVAGAQRGHLMQQFLGESVLLALLALGVAIVLVIFSLSTFGSLAGKTITLADLFAPLFVLMLIGVAVVVGLLAGSYPAFFLSAFRPVAVLKGELRAGAGGGTWLRKGLIVFQFGISLILIISTGIVYTQMEYARNKKLGFDKEHVVVVELTDPNASRHYSAYKDAILQHPKVLSVSAAFSKPGGLVGQATMRPYEASDDQSLQVQTYFSDFDFVETMDMEIVAGRDFSPEFSTDSTQALLINETAARAFGWHDPHEAVGKEVAFTGNNQRPLHVIGVVKDFHSQSIREKIAPTIIAFGGQGNPWFFAFVRIAPGDFPGTIATLERTFQEVIPGYVFLYSFLDDDFDRLYKSEAVLGTLLGYFALLTIFIACLGLFGLASFTAEQRTKEIGVRKTLGASVTSIVLLLSKEFTKLVLVAFVVAVPVAYFAMDRWLKDFAYHVEISWWIFLIAGSLALAIAWLTVSYQSIRAALTNPVKALRYE
ncbi:MAG: FtsX-like permease family protein, partial [Bacteroidetes bacterium]|nr:FtsX-like permease family protein [Bacteroidota bacterium]